MQPQEVEPLEVFLRTLQALALKIVKERMEKQDQLGLRGIQVQLVQEALQDPMAPGAHPEYAKRETLVHQAQEAKKEPQEHKAPKAIQDQKETQD